MTGKQSMAEFRTPPQWPIVEPGLFMDHVGPVLVVRVDEGMSDSAFDRHLRELARAIDERQWKVGVLYDVPAMSGMDAKRRQQLGKLLESRSERLRETTAGYALVTESPLVRGFLRAIFWIAPPPYPYQVAATTRAGFEFLSSKLPGLRGDVLDAEYRELLRQHGLLGPGAPAAST